MSPIKTTVSYIVTPGKQMDQWTPTSLLDQPDFQNSHIAQDPESLIVAMERVNVLFDR